MACEDTRQLTEAQRQAAYQQQRTGVQRAVRPFTGRPTLDNLIDYINRELQPAVRATRDAVNEVYLPVVDNAPSANPLAYYFSTETGAADPTAGRIRLNQATQDTATVIRISEDNARLQDVLPWLEVMAGGITAPLGVITLYDAVNPSRFLRFDLESMTDQGDYWDLGVTIVESSHDNPFVDGGAVTLSYIPGVADNEGTGAVVPPSSIEPIATDTFLGNISGSTAAPSAVPLANIDSTSVVYDATSHTFQRAALTGFAVASQNGNATTSAEPIVTFSASANMTNERVATSSTSVTVSTSVASQIEFQRAALTGAVAASANANATMFAGILNNGSATTDRTNLDFLGFTFTDSSGGDSIQIANDKVFQAVTEAGAGPFNDYALPNLQQNNVTLIPTSGGTVTFTGFESAGGNVDGMRFKLQVSNAVSRVNLTHLSASSLAANTIACPGDADLTITRRGLVEFEYRSGDWRVIAEENTRHVVQDFTTSGLSSDVALNPDCRKLRVDTASSAWSIDGFARTGGNFGGDWFILENASNIGSTGTLVTSGSSVSATGNQIITPGNINRGGHSRYSALMVYDGTDSVWRIAADTFNITDADKGDITVSGNGVTWTIDNDAVTDAKLRNSAALSVIGRSANSSGDPADIAGTASSDAVLRISGTTLGFGTVATAGLADSSVTPIKLAPSVHQLAAGTHNDVAIADTVTAILVTGNATITGIAGGWNGRTLDIICGNATLTVNFNDSVNSTLGNTITTPAGVNYVQLRGGMRLVYDTQPANDVWRVVSTASPTLDGDRGDITVSGLTWTIDSAAVTLAKMANLAQSTIIGRAEGAGTGVPQALTPTQVIAIVDGESPQWTASHRFDSYIQFGTSTGLPSTGDIRKASALRLESGTALTVAAVTDVDITASDDIFLTATDLIEFTAGTGVRVSSAFSLNSVISPTALSANQNDYSPTGWADANVVRLSCSSATDREITGAAAGIDGELKYLINVGTAGQIQLKHEDASSTAANRFRFASLTTFNLDPEGAVGIWYDGTSTRWRAIMPNIVGTLP